MNNIDPEATNQPMRLFKINSDKQGAPRKTPIQVWISNASDLSVCSEIPELYACMVWASELTSISLKNDVSSALVASGCRYIVAGGLEGTIWDDAGDWAYLATEPNYDPPDETFVMTSWHDDEPMKEVLWFLLNVTNFDDHFFTNYLIIHAGDDITLEEELVLQLQCALEYKY